MKTYPNAQAYADATADRLALTPDPGRVVGFTDYWTATEDHRWGDDDGNRWHVAFVRAATAEGTSSRDTDRGDLVATLMDGNTPGLVQVLATDRTFADLEQALSGYAQESSKSWVEQRLAVAGLDA